MKKVIYSLIISIFVISMTVGCGKKEETNNEPKKDKEQEVVKTEADNFIEEHGNDLVKVTHVLENKNDSQLKDWSEEELTEYRYEGFRINNYVTFNDEEWRIVGVFTVDNGKGKKEKRIKIVRSTPLRYAFTYSNDGNNEVYVNFANSDIMKVLNEGYENEGVNNSLYYNSSAGKCYIFDMFADELDKYYITSDCDFSKGENKGLNNTAKAMIDDAVWYLGEADLANASTLWEQERSFSSKNPNPKWIGKVGILYSSDYAYAANEKEFTGSNTCINTDVSNFNTMCGETDWLGETYLRALITNYNVSYDIKYNSNQYVDGYAKVNSDKDNLHDGEELNPSVYLKSNVKVISGTGTKEDPYQLSLN